MPPRPPAPLVVAILLSVLLLPAGAGSRASAAPAAGLLHVVVPQLDPIRVGPDGSVSVPIENHGLLPVDLQLVALAGSADLGHGAGTIGAHDDGEADLTLSPTALQQLEQRTWEDVTVTVDVPGQLGLGNALSLRRSVELVAPSVTTAAAANPTNPLAGLDWGDYQGDEEPVWAPYEHATGATKEQLARVELEPKARWFVSQVPPPKLEGIVARYVAATTAEDPDALVQLTMFVLDPWETTAEHRLPTPHEVALDKQYIAAFVQGIGDAHAMVVVEPDGPFAGEEPHHATTLARLVRLSVQKLAALPNTTSYVDMGSADWHRGDTSKELPLLLSEDVGDTRGFSMDVTHTDSTGAEVEHADKLIRELAARGVPGMHAVIDTSDNGRPFGGADWRALHPTTAPWAAPSCRTPNQRLCVSLGIPPTTDVANPRWDLTPAQERMAAQDVDAYLWIKRPWLDPFHHYDFSMARALQEIRTSPFL